MSGRGATWFQTAFVALVVGGGACGDGASDASACTAAVHVNLVFYDNTGYSGWVECGGHMVEPTRAVRTEVADMDISCTEPDRSLQTIIEWPRRDGSCAFCSLVDQDDLRCVPISGACGVETIEHLAFGYADAGTHPMFDGGCDRGDGGADG